MARDPPPYELDDSSFPDKVDPLAYFGDDVKDIPLSMYSSSLLGNSNDEDDTSVAVVDEIFGPIHEATRYWIFKQLKDYFPLHLNYIRSRANNLALTPSQPPKLSEIEKSCAKHKVPKEIQAHDLGNWLRSTVQTIAQFFGSPAYNIGIFATKAVADYAIEDGIRMTAIHRYINENTTFKAVVLKHNNTVIPALYLLLVIYLRFRITPEQRNEYHNKLQHAIPYHGPRSIIEWMEQWRPLIVAAGWTDAQTMAWLSLQLPSNCASHNMLYGCKTSEEMIQKAQAYFNIFKDQIPKASDVAPDTVLTMTDAHNKASQTCAFHGDKSKHTTADCRVLQSTRGGRRGGYRGRGRGIGHAAPYPNRDHIPRKPKGCHRCGGTHRRDNCPARDMIKELIPTVTMPPTVEHINCYRCEQAHHLSKCPISIGMVQGYALAKNVPLVAALATCTSLNPVQVEDQSEIHANISGATEQTPPVITSPSGMDIDKFLDDNNPSHVDSK